MPKKNNSQEQMNILMLAPEPFFQPRGTPISEYFRIKALSDLGHRIDLLTYHLGKDVEIQNLRIFRIPNLFFIRKVAIGPSWTKLLLDILMVIKTLVLLVNKKYDLIFSHEEASFFGVPLARLWRIPHLYDMHSSLPQQLENFKFSRSLILKAVFRWLENYVLKNSRAVLVICPDLLQKVERQGYGEKAILLENYLEFEGHSFSEEEIRLKRRELVPGGEKIVLYTGNFQPYQGIPLLLEAAAKVKEKAVFLLVGGSGTEMEKIKKKARELKIAEKVIFTGNVEPNKVPFYVSLADVLVSPRISGTNTPLKIYSFMKSGKPLVATDLWTHTQVLNPENSVLVKPDPQSLAQGIDFALSHKEAQQRALNCKKWADREYTSDNYREKINRSLRLACGTT